MFGHQLSGLSSAPERRRWWAFVGRNNWGWTRALPSGRRRGPWREMDGTRDVEIRRRKRALDSRFICRAVRRSVEVGGVLASTKFKMPGCRVGASHSRDLKRLGVVRCSVLTRL